MEIKSLDNTSHDKLFQAFEQAFTDYELQLNKAELLTMLKRRGFNPTLSFAAFDGDKIVSFTCNGIGDFNGTRMAYDTGTGTLKDYRGQGLATQIFEYSIPHLKEAGIKEYLLEVLQHNTGAVSVYSKLGFEVTREFYYFKTEPERINKEVKTPDFPYTLGVININEYDSIPGFWDFNPSWQNSIESINRAPEDFICLGVFTEGRLVGYGVFDPTSGDVTQIAVDKPYRRKGIGSLLLQKMIEANKYTSIKIVNTDIACDSITVFLKAKNIEPTGKQFEMIKKL
ncbi:GNAT family N-acetyltransferase [Butyricimonas paravirosa]|uniref:GNAT family N-acetyltransferase n=1 Tax=Butyricimonas paravirosa TaxID=1472417 RepID=UPI00210E51DA|nr:GNAT family N-acetyltransferase [Butyricimonas paravirosa]MCQ4875604.1 GNAT family N-acetyltransferase [Butyricimonas paravirosa]